VQRLPDTVYKMRVRQRDHGAILPLHDIHDSFERMFRPALGLGIMDEVHDLLAVFGEERSGQCQFPGRDPIVHPLARWTEMLLGLLRRLSPLPSPVLKDRATLGTGSKALCSQAGRGPLSSDSSAGWIAPILTHLATRT